MTLEKGIEIYFKGEVELIKGVTIKGPAMFIAGFPDRICLFPGGRIRFVELKAPGKEPRPLQVKWINRLRSMGFKVLVIDSREGVRNFIADVTKEIATS